MSSPGNIAVVYLARGVDAGTAVAEAFFASHAKHSTGVPHRLYVIAKGWTSEVDYARLRQMASAAGAALVDLPDDGFDLTAYYRIAGQLTEEWVCFLNSFSIIEADGWLKRLFEAAQAPSVGVAGCTGAYGTLRPRLSNVLLNFLDGLRTKRLVTAVSDLVYQAADWWRQSQQSKAFPKFPNPHLRTNAFVLRRKLFLEFWQGRAVPQSKDAVCALESGRDGLTRFVEARGLTAIVVAADGRGYEPAAWPSSKTFCVPGADNALVSDNATRRYLAEGRDYRRKKELANWGRRLTA